MWRVIKTAIAVGVVVLVVVAVWAVAAVRADRPVEYADITEQFKYGSIGSEPGGSLLSTVGGVLPPYAVFKALPEICSDKLPGGLASVGLIVEPGHDLPVGVSRRRRLGIDQVGFNCALCHAGTVRDTPTAAPRVVLDAGRTSRPRNRSCDSCSTARSTTGRRGKRQRRWRRWGSGSRCSNGSSCGWG